MEFIKEFSRFLLENQVLKFGDFVLASGKNSSYYIDLRIIPSFPHQFRKMVRYLQNTIIERTGLDNFDSFVSVPTGGLVIASALAIETVKPLIYVRNKPKDYGTSKLIEGYVKEKTKVLMIDDVATTGGSVLHAIKLLKKEGIQITDAYVIVDRLEGASNALKEQEQVKLHSITDINQITQVLFDENLVSKDILEKIKKQTRNNQ